MTAPATETIEREKDKLYITDAELIRRLGVPEKIGRAVIQELDAKKTGFPPKQKLWGNRRFWPAVEAYLLHTNGLNMDAPPPRRQRNG